MISISNGLLPDLLQQEKENLANEDKQKKQNKDLIVNFSYDNTLEETDSAMLTFQKRFSGKRGKLSIIAYSLLSAAVIVGIVFNPSAFVLYIALAFCAFGLFYSITDRKRTRKKILEALEGMNPEEYSCSIYPDKIEIETVIKPKPNQVNLENDEEEEVLTPLKTVFKFGDDLLNFSENEDSLLLIFNRRQIYCFPKRCLTTEQENTIRDFLTEKLESD